MRSNDASAKYSENSISNAAINKLELPAVKHIVAVASGKGGVGKSTVSANLALALSAEGQQVGLLDADIYGPSQALMMGVPPNTRPTVEDSMLQPIKAHGLQVMSMGFVASDTTPAVWRGPMASSALQQLLVQTAWQDLDVLVVDLPPGTGDIQLTMAQQVPMDGAIIVTTPQDIALLDARKGIEMFRKVEVPVLGIIENMSIHICPECGHEEPIFGTGGGTRIAREYDTELLGQLPLSLAIREQSDGGRPPLVSDPDGDVSRTFREIARRVIDKLASRSAAAAPVIKILDD